MNLSSGEPARADDRSIILALTVLLVLVFGNALFARYAVHDDYWSLDAGLKLRAGEADCLHLVHTASLVQVGRPLAAIAHCGLALGLPRALDLGINHFYVAASALRIVSFLCALAAAISFALVLRRVLPPFSAVAVTALTFFLPGAGVLIAWAVMSIYMPGLLFVAAANLLLLPLLDRLAASEGAAFSRGDIGRFGLIAFCVAISFLFYQVLGFLFLLTPLAMALFRRDVPWQRRRIAVAGLLGAFLLAVILYLAVQKGLIEGVARSWLQLPPSTERTVSLGNGSGMIENLVFFLGYPVRRALNFWLIDDPALLQRLWALLGVMGAAAVATALSVAWRQRRARDWGDVAPLRVSRALIERAAAVAAILVFCAAINFVGERSIKLRVLWPFQACLLLLAIAWVGYVAAPLRHRLSPSRWRALRLGSAAALTAAAGTAVAIGIGRHYVAHAAAEMAFLEAGYGQFLRDPSTTLVIARAHPHGRIYGDEYSVMTGSFYDAAYGIGGMLALLDRKYRLDPAGYQIHFRPGFVILSHRAVTVDALLPGAPGLLFIDFKDLLAAPRVPFVGVTPADVVAISASSAIEGFEAAYLANTAFRNPAWRTSAPTAKSESVIFEFATARPFRGLSLVPPYPEAIADAPGAIDIYFWDAASQRWTSHESTNGLCPRYAGGRAAEWRFDAATPPTTKLKLEIRATCGGAQLTLQAVTFRRD